MSGQSSARELQPLLSTNVVDAPAPATAPAAAAALGTSVTVQDIEANEGIDPDGDDDDALQPFYEIKSLLWIKQNTPYGVALDEWDRKVKLLSDRVDKKEKRSGDLKNEVYQLVGFFSVFQGVVLTAVTQLTQSNDEFHNCKRVWSPVVLTALAWACVIVGVWQKFSRIQVIDDERFEEDEARREAVKRAQLLRNLGDRFKFRDLKEKQKADSPKLYWNFSRHFWINRFGVVVFMLSFFTGIFIASYFLILCNRGLAPIDPSDAPAHL